MSKSVNPEIHEHRKLTALAKELNEWLDFEWSHLYGSSPETIIQFRDQIIMEFTGMPIAVLRSSCPQFVEYMSEDCKMNVHLIDWASLAIALDNLNGMYHPLRLTKFVLREQDE